MTAEKNGRFTIASPLTLQNSLARKLIPVADGLRDLFTRFGGRPYRVRLIRTHWSGGRRERGVEVVTHQLEILPTPLVIDLGTLEEVVTPIGRTEWGQVQIQQISGRYTGDQLIGVDPQGNPPGVDDSVYYEIEGFRPDGQPGERRRMQIDTAPDYKPFKFQWTVTLDKAVSDRNRDGTPP